MDAIKLNNSLINESNLKYLNVLRFYIYVTWYIYLIVCHIKYILPACNWVNWLWDRSNFLSLESRYRDVGKTLSLLCTRDSSTRCERLPRKWKKNSVRIYK